MWPQTGLMDAPTYAGPLHQSSGNYTPGSRSAVTLWTARDGSIWMYGGQAIRGGST
jgi:hypothetical protein